MNYEERFPTGMLMKIKNYPKYTFEVKKHYPNSMTLVCWKRNLWVSVKYSKHGTMFWEAVDDPNTGPPG